MIKNNFKKTSLTILILLCLTIVPLTIQAKESNKIYFNTFIERVLEENKELNILKKTLEITKWKSIEYEASFDPKLSLNLSNDLDSKKNAGFTHPTIFSSNDFYTTRHDTNSINNKLSLTKDNEFGGTFTFSASNTDITFMKKTTIMS